MLVIIKWGLWARRWSLIWWSIGLVVLIAMVILIYPSFRDQSAQLEQSFTGIPDAAKALFTDTQDFLSPVGYLSSQLYYLVLPLLFSILSISLGSSLLAKEEQDGTLELLLSKPISRTKIISAKAIVGLIIMTVVTLVSIVFAVLFSEIVNIGVGSARIAETTLLATTISVLFGMIAFALSAFGGFGKTMSVGVAALVAFSSYIISSLSEVVSWLSGPAKLLPFHYYQPAEVLYGTYNWIYAGVMAGVILVLFVVAVIGFRSRDLKN